MADVVAPAVASSVVALETPVAPGAVWAKINIVETGGLFMCVTCIALMLFTCVTCIVYMLFNATHDSVVFRFTPTQCNIAAYVVSNAVLMYLGWVIRQLGQQTVPAGSIMAFSGRAIPDGWSLCNGQNDTPDLRNRFVLGADGLGENGQTGGSNNHTHSVHVDITLDIQGNTRGWANNRIGQYRIDDDAIPLRSLHGKQLQTNTTTGRSDHMPPWYKLAYIQKRPLESQAEKFARRIRRRLQ